jgi:hypothetical protein
MHAPAIRRIFSIAFFLTLGVAPAANVNLSSGTGSTGSTVTLNLLLSDASTRPLSGLQFTLTYSAAHFTNVTLAAGPALTASGKSLLCAGAQAITCVVFGRNTLQIPGGTIGVVSATLASGSATTRVLNFTAVLGANATGNAETVGSAGGSITIIQTPADTTPPSVSVIQPSANANLAGTVVLTANASDNAAVAGVQFLVDGTGVGSEITQPPYSISWNSATVADGAHTIAARARDTAGLLTTSTIVPVQVANGGSGNEPSGPLVFYPLAPCRAVDTRVAAFGAPFGPPRLRAQSTRTFPLASGSCSVPSSARAYSVNVTVVPISGLAYLSAWPAGQPQPVVSTLNSFDGRVVANSAIIPSGASGGINVFASDDTELIIDINGYFDAPDSNRGLAFYSLTPCRVSDSRVTAYAAPFGTPSVQPGAIRTLPLYAGSCAIPSIAQAYSLNVTAVPLTPSLGYLTVWPAGLAFPGVSTLNSWTGTVVANAAIVPAGASGGIQLLVTDLSDVVIDTNGYFAPPGFSGALSFRPVTPCRAADTRLTGQALPANSARDFNLRSSPCGIPSTAQAYSVNITAVPQGILQYLTVWPSGTAQPWVSTLNSWNGAVVANAAIVPAGANGAIRVYASDRTDVIIDINGYFGP